MSNNKHTYVLSRINKKCDNVDCWTGWTLQSQTYESFSLGLVNNGVTNSRNVFINMTISDFFLYLPVLYANCRVGIQQSWGNVFLSEAMRALTYIVI